MQRVDATPLMPNDIVGSSIDIASLSFESGTLVVTLASGSDPKAATVKFEDVLGFRMLDEGDLLEYWPACSRDNGWLFLINGDGWFDLESTRPGFLHQRGGRIAEYFLATQNGCVSVLAGSAPTMDSQSP